MSKIKEGEYQKTNGNGKASQSKYERLPKDYEVDESEAAKAFMKAARMTNKRLYPELYKEKAKRG